MTEPRKPHLRTQLSLVLEAVGCLTAAVCMAMLILGSAGTVRASGAGSRGAPVPCSQQRAISTLGPTTLRTLNQAYWCIFAHYYGGPTLDDGVLLAGAFAGLTQELNRLGRDQADATMPSLDGIRARDWNAFAAGYERIVDALPHRTALREEVAAATMRGMVAALNDNHARWQYPEAPPHATPSDSYGLGLVTSPAPALAKTAPAEALAPLFVTTVLPGSPAAHARVRPGDVITSVNSAPPFTDGVISPGVIDLLTQQYPQQQPLWIALRWPTTRAKRTITITPGLYKASGPHVTSRLLDSAIAYVKLPEFIPTAADEVRGGVSRLAATSHLQGLILDLRGNPGGVVRATAQLLGAFEHGIPWSYDCTVTNRCTPNYPDASTPLLHLPLVVLTDRNCGSGCDAFSAAVKDLRLGTLVGTRTAGIVSGPAAPYTLNDGSLLLLPSKYELGPHHEIINGIGVAPDYYLPLTPTDLATGNDPDIAKALSLLGR